MSAKKSSPTKPAPAAVPAPVAAAAANLAAETAGEPAWIDSTDPRRRLVGQVVLVALCLYVAALWLLALDQWFNWGIFGPKIPPVP
jgi:hypothetical protein